MAGAVDLLPPRYKDPWARGATARRNIIRVTTHDSHAISVPIVVLRLRRVIMRTFVNHVGTNVPALLAAPGLPTRASHSAGPTLGLWLRSP